MHKCSITIDGSPFCFNVEGQVSLGNDEVLYNPNGVISKTSWQTEGFTVADIFNEDDIKQLIDGTTQLLVSLFDELGINCPASFTLEQYHRVVTTDEQHQAVIKHTRTLTNDRFPINLDNVASRVSTIINRTVSGNNADLMRLTNKTENVILRISRPGHMDLNPLHRDGYLDVWKNVLNVWIPIAGCTKQTSLTLIPGSHLWNEASILRTDCFGASIVGNRYSVPAIVAADQPLSCVRPNPHIGQALLFTPFIIHGAGINQTDDITRFSFELRLYDEECVEI